MDSKFKTIPIKKDKKLKIVDLEDIVLGNLKSKSVSKDRKIKDVRQKV